MKLARLLDESAVSRFVVSTDTEHWFALDAGVTTTPEAMDAVDDAAAIARAFAGPALTPSNGQLDCPVFGSSKVIGVGRNYSDHRTEMGRATPTDPILFTKWPNSLVGPNGDVEIDSVVAPRCDHEVELAVVLRHEAANVTVADAMDHVWGYSVANDVTSREVQQSSTTWDLSKGFDTFGPIGPWITTADEVADWKALELKCSINGVLVQNALAGEMTFGVPELIAFLSRRVTLLPGDVILTGTPAGVRAATGQSQDRLMDGDLMTCEIDGLGTMNNRVRMIA
jgi:2-keto-4-pentenoate hydratase/2-oxohepta-3-ene-1,7-dioic acid hydratase in catechol pathway